jgi:NADH-quinone oxidoreductase subunit G
MSTELIKVTINGKEFEVANGALLIDVCRENEYSIPSFCYYKDLELQASCRMCLVRIERCRSCKRLARSSALTV